jgi:hypothetical protein
MSLINPRQDFPKNLTKFFGKSRRSGFDQKTSSRKGKSVTTVARIAAGKMI